MSLLLKIAWRNIWRHPRRSLLTIAAIAFAATVLIFTLSWQFGNYRIMINTLVRLRCGHLQIQVDGFQKSKDIRASISNPAALDTILANQLDIQSFSHRASTYSLVSSQDRTYGASIIGVGETEHLVSSLPTMIRRGAYFSSGHDSGVLVGNLLANNLKVDIGDELVILGQGYDGSVAATVLPIRGIFSSGEDAFDRNSVFMPLEEFQSLYNMQETIHEIVIMCSNLDAIGTTKRDLSQTLQQMPQSDLIVLDWQQILPGLRQAIQADFIYGFVFYSILIIIVAFSILNTFLMTIFERTREFGMMVAVGCKQHRLVRLLIYESSIIILIGTGLGIVCGALVSRYFQTHGILMPGAVDLAQKYGFPDRMYPYLSIRSTSIGASIVLLVSMATAFIPTLRLRKLKPVQAMNAV